MQKTTITLGEICTIEKGKIGIQAAKPGQYPLVTTGEERSSHDEFHFEGEAVCIPLVSGTGHGHASIKRLHYQKGKFCVGSILAAVIPRDYKKTSAKFLYLYFTLLKDSILVPLMQGSANVSLKLKDLYNVEVPNVSLEEQLKAVDLIERVRHQQFKLNKEFEFQQTHLQQLRQAILQEAVQGKLTQQNADDEPADKLLQRIKAEKQQLIVAGKLKKEKELPPINKDEIPFELPKGWVWCRLSEVSKQITDGEHITPPRVSTGFRLLSAKNVRDGFINYENCDFVTKEIFEKCITRCNPEIGDLLIISVGGTIGRTSLITENIPFAIVRSVAMIKPLIIDSNYLRIVMNSPLLQSIIANKSRGGAQPCLYLNEIQRFIFPLPPLSEQQLIVIKVQQLLQTTNQLDQEIAHNQTLAQQLLQAVLKEAFAGKAKSYAENEMLTMAAE